MEPNYKPYMVFPTKKSEGVISTDVLEHIPEEEFEFVHKTGISLFA